MGDAVRVRAAVEYTDGVGESVEAWPDAYRHADTARRWQAAVAAAHPAVSLQMELEVECPRHGWQAMTECVDCHDPLCWRCAEKHRSLWDDAICEDCQDDRREDGESFCRCPGEAEPGRCHCPACVG